MPRQLEVEGEVGVRAGFQHLRTMRRTNHRVDNNLHHTTNMKDKSIEAVLAQNSFSFSLLHYPPGAPHLTLGMLVLGYISP